MEYPEYLAKGWCIGSGAAEGACKTAVGQRLKSAGMRRGEDGAHDADMNAEVPRRAKAGIFPSGAMREYTHNSWKAGGRKSSSESYTAGHGGAAFSPSLRENIVSSRHNLATDGSFDESNLIHRRDVMIDFATSGRAHAE